MGCIPHAPSILYFYTKPFTELVRGYNHAFLIVPSGCISEKTISIHRNAGRCLLLGFSIFLESCQKNVYIHLYIHLYIYIYAHTHTQSGLFVSFHISQSKCFPSKFLWKIVFLFYVSFPDNNNNNNKYNNGNFVNYLSCHHGLICQ